MSGAERGNSPTWVNVRVKLGDLRPWQLNPRHITRKQALRLAESFDEFGQVETIAVGPDLDVYNGHQRLSVLHKLHGPDYEIDTRQANRPLTDDEQRKLVVYLHAGAVGDWDWDALANWDADNLIQWGFDGDLLGDWKKNIAALGNLLESEEKDTFDTMRNVEGYDASIYNEAEPFKLAYRVEAAWQSRGNLAIDLFSGTGQLAAWYRRRFKRVVTNDKYFPVGSVDYSLSAIAFIQNILPGLMDFDFIDFDDEGCPSEEIKTFFASIQGKKHGDFILALTDGHGLGFKVRERFNPRRYLMDGETRQATSDDYAKFEEYVTTFVEKCATAAGFYPSLLSTYRRTNGNVVYQTWRINCAAQSGVDCNNLLEGTVASLA